MCEAIYVGNTQQPQNNIIDGHFSVLLHILKNRQKPVSFLAYFEQHFNATTLHTDLGKHMTFKVVNQLKPIVAIKPFMKSNCNLCMEERLTILKVK